MLSRKWGAGRQSPLRMWAPFAYSFIHSFTRSRASRWDGTEDARGTSYC